MNLENGKKRCPSGYKKNKHVTNNYPYECMLNSAKRRCPNNYHKTPSGCVKNKTAKKSVRKIPTPKIDMDLYKEHVRQPPDMELYDAYYPKSPPKNPPKNSPKRSTRKVPFWNFWKKGSPKSKRSAPSPVYKERFYTPEMS